MDLTIASIDEGLCGLAARLECARGDVERTVLSLLGRCGVDEAFFRRTGIFLPPGADNYLRPDNPRLLELRESYAAFQGAQTNYLWRRDYVVSEVPLLGFRDDSAFVWQRRENTPVNYLLTAQYLLGGPHASLFRTLTDDALFGCFTVPVGDGLEVSRDRLDSVCEIAFLDSVLSLSSGSRRTILDIGAGYGRLGHRLSEAFPNVGVFCTDAIPESTFLTEYYLGFRGVAPRARAVPLPNLEQTLCQTRPDAAVNVHSFSECTLESISWWLDLLRRHCVPYLLVVPNAERHGGTELLSLEPGGVRLEFLSLIESRGYRRVACAPKYENTEVQRYGGVSPTWHHLFKLDRQVTVAQPPRAGTRGLDGPSEKTRFMPEQVMWIGPDFGFVPATGRSFTYPGAKMIHEAIAGRRHFATLDEIAIGLIGATNLRSLAEDGSPARAPAGGWGTVIRMAARWQVRMYRRNPEFRTIRAALAELSAAGALVSDVDLIGGCGVATAPDARSPITVVALDGSYPEHDLLARAVSVVAAQFKRFERSPRLIRVDDSAPISSEHSDTRGLASQPGHIPLQIRGRREKRVLAGRLESIGVPSAQVTFGLFGDPRIPGTGGSRNAALLWAAGQCVLFNPERAFWPARSSNRRTDLILTEVAYRDPAGRRAAVADDSVDVLSVHEKFLGRSVSEMLRPSDSLPVDFTWAGPHVVDSLRRRAGTVRATMADAVTETRHGPTMTYGPPWPVVFHEARVSADSFALDARMIVPPFLPCGSDSSRLFFLLLLACQRDSYLVQLPSAHPVKRRPADGVYGLPQSIALTDLIESALSLMPPILSLDAPGRLKEIGQFFCDVAAWRQVELEERLLLGLLQRIGMEIIREESAMYDASATRDRVDTWKRAARDVSRTGLRCDELAFDSHAARVEALRELLWGYGQLLESWPRMFEYCKSREGQSS